MNIEPSTEQSALVDAVASFFGSEMPADRFLKQAIRTDANWRAVAELGLLGIALPETSGGIGLGSAEEVLLFREAGRFLVSPCAIASAIAATMAAGRGDRALCGRLVSGDARAALAIPNGDDVLLVDSEGCDFVVLATRSPLLLERNQCGAGSVLDALDGSVSLIEAPLADAARRRAAEAGDGDATGLRLTLLTSAYLCGLASAACATAVAYANQREQFGRPIGSFQAIAHICADMAVQSEAAWKQTLMAALVVQEQAPEPEFHAAAAYRLAARAALKAARDGIQVHGGVGFTQEYTPHLYLKRAHLMQRVMAGRSDTELLLNGGLFD